ncbi:MAG: sulfotransferase domain-containing protein [Phycisphaerales bacterium JB059]
MTYTQALSFPKSGRTWVEVMAAKAQSLTSGLPVESFLAGKLDADALRRAGLPVLEFGHGREKRRITGDGAFPVDVYRGVRVALLVRDPRDVVVSRYHYERHQHHRFDADLESFIRFQPGADPEANARWGLGPIINWMNAWARHRAVLGAFHLMRYEDIHRDPAASLGALLRFARIDAPPDAIAQAVEYGRFDNMRALERSNTLRWPGLPNAPRPEGLKTRRGVAGGFREELPGDLVAWLDDQIEARLDPFFDCYRAPQPVAG